MTTDWWTAPSRVASCATCARSSRPGTRRLTEVGTLATETKRTALRWVKQGLTLIGARTPGGVLYSIQMALNYLRLGRWMREHGFEFSQRLPRRSALFDFVAQPIRDQKVLYLEFGVHKGWSIRY